MGLGRKIISVIEEQYPHQFLWWPVFFGAGIGAYFTLTFEPSRTALGVSALIGLAGFAFFCVHASAFYRLPCLPMIALMGFAWAGWAAHRADAPKIETRYYGPVWGRVISSDKSLSGKIRFTLDEVTIPGMARAQTPARVRFSLHGKGEEGDGKGLLPGHYVMATVYLTKPAGAVEPGGFDFARHAWFLKLGAVGYTRAPVLEWQEPDQGVKARMGRFRANVSAHIQTKIPGLEGQFASAILTGDRANLDQNVLDSLRKTNLAHILAISGLHMGLVAGFVFILLQALVSGIPRLSIYVSGKKIAALAAMFSTLLYLYLSGAAIATQRAYVMIVVVFVAVLIDRKAISLRSVALAALLVLILQPQSLLSPGFQMSFAATTALIATFRAPFVKETIWQNVPRILRPVLSLMIASFVAGLATAPIAAAYFNQIAHYGLLANLASIPVMGALIMPGGVIAAILTPLGLEEVGFSMMRVGISWILFVAQEIASWPGAARPIPQSPTGTLTLFYLGMLIAILWIGPVRWVGLALPAFALILWANAQRPSVLVSEGGGLIGVLTLEGRILNKARGDGFAARSWLENDGDSSSQRTAFERAGLKKTGQLTEIWLGPYKILHGYGKNGARAALANCEDADLVIAPLQAGPAPPECRVIGADKTRQMGALAITLRAGELHITSANRPRLWGSALKLKRKRRAQ